MTGSGLIVLPTSGEFVAAAERMGRTWRLSEVVRAGREDDWDVISLLGVWFCWSGDGMFRAGGKEEWWLIVPVSDGGHRLVVGDCSVRFCPGLAILVPRHETIALSGGSGPAVGVYMWLGSQMPDRGGLAGAVEVVTWGFLRRLRDLETFRPPFAYPR